MKARTQTANQIQAIIEAAPPALRESLRGLSFAKLIPIARRLRWRAQMTPLSAARLTLKGLADRWAVLDRRSVSWIGSSSHWSRTLRRVWSRCPELVRKQVARSWWRLATTQTGSAMRRPLPHCAERAPLMRRQDATSGIV
jgi:hypothetical protein